MFTRRKSIDGNQTVLSGFVNKQDKQDRLDKNRTTSDNPRTPKEHNYSTTSSSSAKKRNRPVSSPDFASAHTKVHIWIIARKKTRTIAIPAKV